MEFGKSNRKTIRSAEIKIKVVENKIIKVKGRESRPFKSLPLNNNKRVTKNVSKWKITTPGLRHVGEYLP